jgi:hypothetical protein
MGLGFRLKAPQPCCAFASIRGRQKEATAAIAISSVCARMRAFLFIYNFFFK